ncbi:MAG TPA: Fic family protein [Kofleriaceae bacterium]|nr:Fic family protein [Kofleriaceae bacterium]
MPGPDERLPPVLFPGTTSTERRRIAELKAAGRIRPVGPRLYVSVPKAETARKLQQTWSTIVARLFPDALVSHRTALEFRPNPDGEIFITARSNRTVRYPGLVLRFVRGPGPLPDDPPFLTIRTSSQARAFLENLSARAAGRSIPIEQLEAKLEQILHLGGEAELNELRTQARKIAHKLGWSQEFKRLDGLLGTLLGTRKEHLTSAVARARALGEPFDAPCLERLQLLFAELRAPLPEWKDSFAAPDHFKNKAFFESYFSNYIEGTTFEIEEAEEIVFDKKIPASRPKDAHDITGTFAVVSDPVEMRQTPADLEALLHLLRSRHSEMMAQRPEAEPGTFKTKPNRAGETEFVHPAYVIGTLRKGMELYKDLRAGLPRAIFMMFLVSDVHPFVDGNGRTARIMMNAELIAAGQPTIIIPNVFRDDYLQALRALTRRNRPALIVQALVKAQRFSHLPFSPYPRILKELQRRNWFRDPDETRIID